jgi:hypothetical protein
MPTGRVKSADEVEGLLIQEMRQPRQCDDGKLGCRRGKTLGSSNWSKRTISARARKKKTLKWWCVFGLVRVRERVWRTGQKKYLRLLPEGIGVSPRGRSTRLERALTDFGCEHSFGHAAARVREHYGFEISTSAVREATLSHAQRAARKLQEHYEESFRSAARRGSPSMWWLRPMER